MICVSVHAASVEEMLEKIKLAEEQADIVELRIDSLWANLGNELVSQIGFLLAALNKKSIVTLRSVSEGGFFDGDKAIKNSILHKALECGASYIDLEYHSGLLADFVDKKEKMIASYHDYSATPSLDQLQTLAAKMLDAAGTCKIVSKIEKMQDQIVLYNLQRYLREQSQKFIVFGMGDLSRNSRLLAPVLGSSFTYAYLDEPQVRGQMSIQEIKNAWNNQNPSIKTAICGGFGFPLNHSAGESYHNQAYAKQGIDAIYLLFETDSAEELIEIVHILDMKQASITAPLKQEVIPLLDELDKEAEELGAVNTIINKKDKLRGYNTDLDGFKTLLSENKIELKDKKVLLLGAGGAAKVIARVILESKCASFTILNKTLARAENLAQKYGADFDELENLKNHQCDILIDATSIGLDSKLELAAPWMKEDFKVSSAQVVISLVYEPAETYLLQKAKRSGAKAINGWDMFCAQADKQIKLWR